MTDAHRSTESLNRLAQATRSTDRSTVSHERTNERTNEEATRLGGESSAWSTRGSQARFAAAGVAVLAALAGGLVLLDDRDQPTPAPRIGYAIPVTVTSTATVTHRVTRTVRVSRQHSRPAVSEGRPSSTGGPSPAQWAALRRCESGDNYRAVSRSGRYRGAYQFDLATWAAYGPAGDPAAASPTEQDRRARALYAARGAQPWPICGRHLR